MRHKRWLVRFLITILFFSQTADLQTVYAASNHVTSIDIEVVIRNDGSALITQRWAGEFETGTENYIPIATGDIGISDFSVSDENGSYSLVESWDVKASFDEKKQKCGVVTTTDGVELCFGITEYGHKEYTLSYVVTDFIKGYTDYNGTNFMFINPQMSTFPTAGVVTLRLENGVFLNDANAGIWAFGYEGEVEFQEGCVIAYTTEDLNGNDYMTVMLQLDLSLLSPKTALEQSFEEVKAEAWKGSDYLKRELVRELKLVGLIMVGFFLSMLLIVGMLFFCIGRRLIRRDKEIEEFYAALPFYKDIPNGGNLEVSCYLAKTFAEVKDEQILGALLLSMMNQRSIEFGRASFAENAVEEEAASTNADDEMLHLLLEPEGKAEKLLYQLMAKAANGTGMIRENALADYIYEHYHDLTRVIDAAKKNGKRTLMQQGAYRKRAGRWLHHLSGNGKEELAQLLGLKKYLKEETGIEENSIPDTTLWRTYMVYATLFCMETPVLQKMEKLYPKYSSEFKIYKQHHRICHSYSNRMHSSMKRAMRASGGGGSSSGRGGGGHSGGGHGGGSR